MCLLLLKCWWSMVSRIGSRRLCAAARFLIPRYRSTLFFSEVPPGGCARVALTIDDGICRGEAADSLAPAVVELLQRHGARATFFVCSDYCSPDAAAALLAAGCELGNHLKRDQPYALAAADAFEADLLECDELIRRCHAETPPPTGAAERGRWYRSPQGVLTRRMRDVLARQRGMVHVLGDAYCDDWAVDDPAFISRTLLRMAQPGSIIIMHMPEAKCRRWCLDALRLLLEGLGERGLACVTLSELRRPASSS
mmetsp:Transcript_24593/g.73499  ORF Transcript_24593/g.73499 Transcript_24593/m.73499 type:complete len:254 (-) Transcript_24593:33-794(-)